MATFERLDIGSLALVQETEDGRIRQIGLTEEQSTMLQLFLTKLSREQPLVQMGSEYDLVLKSELEKK